jgi:hypothetical protein
MPSPEVTELYCKEAIFVQQTEDELQVTFFISLLVNDQCDAQIPFYV